MPYLHKVEHLSLTAGQTGEFRIGIDDAAFTIHQGQRRMHGPQDRIQQATLPGHGRVEVFQLPHLAPLPADAEPPVEPDQDPRQAKKQQAGHGPDAPGHVVLFLADAVRPAGHGRIPGRPRHGLADHKAVHGPGNGGQDHVPGRHVLTEARRQGHQVEARAFAHTDGLDKVAAGLQQQAHIAQLGGLADPSQELADITGDQQDPLGRVVRRNIARRRHRTVKIHQQTFPLEPDGQHARPGQGSLAPALLQQRPGIRLPALPHQHDRFQGPVQQGRTGKIMPGDELDKFAIDERGMGRYVAQGLTVPRIKAAVPPMLLFRPGGLPQLAQQGHGQVRLRYLRRQQTQHVVAGHLRHSIALDTGPYRHHGRCRGRIGGKLAARPVEDLALFRTVEAGGPGDRQGEQQYQPSQQGPQ